MESLAGVFFSFEVRISESIILSWTLSINQDNEVNVIIAERE